MHFSLVYLSSQTHECECCGFYSGEGVKVLLDNEQIWIQYYDGHLGGERSEGSLLENALSAWNEKVKLTIEQNHTEEKRLAWERNHRGSHISSSPELWQKHCQYVLQAHRKNYDVIKECCLSPKAVVPQREELQMRFLLLWIEDITGDKIALHMSDELV